MMRYRALLLFCASFAITAGSGAWAGQPEIPVSAHEPADQRQPVVSGQLPNGLSYAILKRQGKEPGVAIRIRVKGGFLAEQRPGERGLAHLVEHLVYYGPTEKAPDKLWRFREVALPLSFFEPAGGTTTWRESDYFVVSRTSQESDLDILLDIFSEVLTQLAFRPDAVDQQRAEVMREMADKKLGNDIYGAYIAAIAPGSPTDVINAQNSDDVPTASIDRIRALYNDLYRPENASLVIVGDVDPVAVGAMINARFGAWRGRGTPREKAKVPQFRADRIDPVSHAAQKYGRNSAMLTNVTPIPAPPSSRAAQAGAMIMDMLVSRAITNRMATTRPDYPPGKFGFFIEQGEMGHRLMIFWDDFVPGRWQPAVASLQKIRCELQGSGFDDGELEKAKSDLLRELKQQADNADGASNFQVAKDLADALTLDKHLIPPDELVRAAASTLPSVTTKTMRSWWQNQWPDQTSHLRVESPVLAQIEDPNSAISAVIAETNKDIGCRYGLKN